MQKNLDELLKQIEKSRCDSAMTRDCITLHSSGQNKKKKKGGEKTEKQALAMF